MSKLKVLRRIAVVATAISLTSGAGIAAAATGTLETTGPWSDNNIEVRHEDSRYVQNDNNVAVSNDNPQDAVSGDVDVRKNTTGGDAESGAAGNDSLLTANLSVDNTGAASAANEATSASEVDHEVTISETGPSSENNVEIKTESEVVVENTNNISIVNTNTQNARSGNVSVYGNTTGGNATSGDASNLSTTDVTLEIAN